MKMSIELSIKLGSKTTINKQRAQPKMQSERGVLVSKFWISKNCRVYQDLPKILHQRELMTIIGRMSHVPSMLKLWYEPSIAQMRFLILINSLR